MHFKHFGLEKNPFEITPDPQFLYLGEKHREALSHLTYSVLAKKPFLLLTGDIGVGKTTILHYFLQTLRKNKDIYVISIFNPKLTTKEFYSLLAAELGWRGRILKSHFLLKFKHYLLNLFREGKTLVIAIDEAQAAPKDLLEEIRLLANITEGEQGLVIILVGQPELLKKLSSPKLYSLQQRFSYRYHLGPFETKEEVSDYLVTRILRAGTPKSRIFTDEAIELIFKHSRGIPRLINIIADHAMMGAYLKGESVVDAETVEECLPDIKHLLEGREKKEKEPLPPPPSAEESPSRRWKYLVILLCLPIILLLLWLFKDEILNLILDLWRQHWAS